MNIPDTIETLAQKIGKYEVTNFGFAHGVVPGGQTIDVMVNGQVYERVSYSNVSQNEAHTRVIQAVLKYLPIQQPSKSSNNPQEK